MGPKASRKIFRATPLIFMETPTLGKRAYFCFTAVPSLFQRFEYYSLQKFLKFKKNIEKDFLEARSKSKVTTNR